MNQYVSHLVKDLGSPPNRVQAEKLSKRLFINIHYQSPEISWKTSGTLPPLDQYVFRELRSDQEIEHGRKRHSKEGVFRVKNGEQVLYIFTREKKSAKPDGCWESSWRLQFCS